jgi:hypothetical protein
MGFACLTMKRVKRVLFQLVVLIIAVGGLVACASKERSRETQIRAVPLQFEEGKVFTSGDCFGLEIRGSFIQEVTVAADGTVALPLLSDRFKVAGLNAREVAKLVAESYRPDGPHESQINITPCWR